MAVDTQEPKLHLAPGRYRRILRQHDVPAVVIAFEVGARGQQRRKVSLVQGWRPFPPLAHWKTTGRHPQRIKCRRKRTMMAPRPSNTHQCLLPIIRSIAQLQRQGAAQANNPVTIASLRAIEHGSCGGCRHDGHASCRTPQRHGPRFESPGAYAWFRGISPREQRHPVSRNVPRQPGSGSGHCPFRS